MGVWGGDSERCAELTSLALSSSSQTRRPLQELSMGRLLRRTGAIVELWISRGDLDKIEDMAVVNMSESSCLIPGP